MSEQGNSTALPDISTLPWSGGSTNGTSGTTTLSRDVIDLQNWAEFALPLVSSVGGLLTLVLGTVGNGLTMGVMRREKMKSAVATVYLMALAIADTSLLWVGVVHWWITSVFGTQIRMLHTVPCKLHTFAVSCLMMQSSWILVFVTVQRMLIVLFPFRAKNLATRRKAFISLIVLVIVTTAYNTYSLVAADLHHTKSAAGTSVTICTYLPQFHEFHNKYWSVLTLLMSLIFPCGTVFISNIVIIFKVTEARIKRSALVKTDTDDGQVKQMTATLISVSIIFLITNVPLVVMQFLSYPSPQDVKYTIIFKTILQFGTFLTSLNSAINFLLYCITGPTFRTELRAMLCNCCFKPTPPIGDNVNSANTITTSTSAV